MRAWLLRSTGPPDVLQLTDVPTPEPGPGEVAVRVEAIGINFAEVLSRKGLYGWAPERPYVPGMEVAGTIDAVGEGVDRRPGERVLCGMKHGGYAERVVVDEALALPAPEGFSIEESAAFGVSFITAWVSLREMARLRPEDRVAITAAAGGVGTAAVRIAVAHGCDVIGLVGSGEKLDRVRALGARTAVAYRTDDFRERWREVTRERRPDVVHEVVGGDVFRACVERLAPFGRIVVVGYAGLDYDRWNPFSWWRAWRDAPRLGVREAAERSIGILSSHVGYLLPEEAVLRRVWTELTAFVEQHDLRPVVGHAFAFEELPEAHRLMESRRSVGKIVLRVGEGAAGR